MTTISLNRKEIEKQIGKIDKELEERIIDAGIEIDNLNETEIIIDVTPNRPDIISTEGFVRYMKNYLGKGELSNHEVEGSKYEIIIDKTVKDVRPITVCAVVKNLKLDDRKIRDLIDIQEKLHNTIGRKRKRMAMGVYPLEKIKFPVRFLAKKPSEIKFRPLGLSEEMSGTQILKQHPTGRDYAELLEGMSLYPIFIDANEKILSMPPIINSHETGKIDENTKELFVECSGFSEHYLGKSLNILISALADMGAEIYSVKIKGEKNFDSPNLERQKIEFKIEEINKTLGIELNVNDIENLLKKMDIGIKKENQKTFALVPAYRIDVLHWIDIAEDIAIAYGYKNFVPEIPKISTIAEEDKMAFLKKILGDILSGAGFLECSSLHLNTKEEIKKVHYQFNSFIELENSKTEYNVLRIDLLTNLMKIFSENTDSQYPQKIFEVGKVFELDNRAETKIKEKEFISMAICEEKTDFTEIKRILNYLFKMLDKKYVIEETENSNFIPGRVGKILVDGEEIGLIGEISPRVLQNWKIDFPIAAVEMKLEKIV